MRHSNEPSVQQTGIVTTFRPDQQGWYEPYERDVNGQAIDSPKVPPRTLIFALSLLTPRQPDMSKLQVDVPDRPLVGREDSDIRGVSCGTSLEHT